MIHRILGTVVCLSLFLFLSIAEVSTETPDHFALSAGPAFYEAGSGAELSKPVIRPLSRILQRASAEISSDTVLNSDEGDSDLSELPSREEIPRRLLPQHSFQQDHPHSNANVPQTVSAPAVKTSFPGIPYVLKVQPDSTLAVGPTHLVLAVNTTVAIYTKSGQKRFQTTFQSWFAGLSNVAGAVLFDPRLLYDQDHGGHFIFTCAARHDHRSWILLSVSKTSDPEGQWAFWALDMQHSAGFTADLWADFPRLGMDQKAIYLTADMTTFGSFRFRYSKLRILNKSRVYAFQSIGWHDFWQMIDASGNYAIHLEPAQTFGSGAEYLVNTRFDAGNVITLWSVTNPTSSTPQLSKIAVPVSSYKVPPYAYQKGGGAVLVTATEGTGVLKVVSRNGFIYASHPIAHDWGSGLVSAIRYYQMDTTGKMIHEVTYGSDGLSYYMPTLMVDGAGDVVLAFNRSGKSEFAGIFFAGRKASDPSGKFSGSYALKEGLANYELTFPTNPNLDRWGDYNGIALDPDGSIWVYGEYAKSVDQHATWVGQVSY